MDYRCDVEDLADRVGVDIPRSALYDTVGGFTCDCFDHIPEVGETMLITLPIKASASSWDEIGGDDDGRGGTEHDQRSGSLGVDNGVYEKDADSQKNVEKDTRDTGYGMCPVRLTVTDGDQKMVRRYGLVRFPNPPHTVETRLRVTVCSGHVARKTDNFFPLSQRSRARGGRGFGGKRGGIEPASS